MNDDRKSDLTAKRPGAASPTASDTIRTPAEVALAMRYTAGAVERARGVAPSALATLLVTWADIIDGALRDPLPEIVADRLPLAAEIDSAADMVAGEIMTGGGKLDLPPDRARSLVAWMREWARQAAALAQGRELTGEAALRQKPATLAGVEHPDDVAVPGLETAAGDHVTFALLDRLAKRRAGGRPCGSEPGGAA